MQAWHICPRTSIIYLGTEQNAEPEISSIGWSHWTTASFIKSNKSRTRVRKQEFRSTANHWWQKTMPTYKNKQKAMKSYGKWNLSAQQNDTADPSHIIREMRRFRYEGIGRQFTFSCVTHLLNVLYTVYWHKACKLRGCAVSSCKNSTIWRSSLSSGRYADLDKAMRVPCTCWVSVDWDIVLASSITIPHIASAKRAVYNILAMSKKLWNVLGFT